jgi:predicted AAA+ superfamily ATPase
MNLGTDRRKILKWIFKKLAGKAWNELVWLTTRTGGGYL